MPNLDFSTFGKPDSLWWIEGGERCYVEDGRLVMCSEGDAPKTGMVCTAWYKNPLPADFSVELDAHVLSSPTDANNINLFFCYADPSGKPLYETRDSRKFGEYNLYHDLNGHIITFLNDNKAEGGRLPDGSTRARTRIRRCPGFQLLSETFNGTCRKGVTYNLKVTKKTGAISFYVDGKLNLSATDPHPLPGGLFGLRTFQTKLWWGNIRVTV
jgi:hypothetical protein